MFLMGLMSFGLLAYIGTGEISQKYPGFEFNKVTAQTSSIQSSIESYLSTGLPLAQYVGFETLVAPILKSDPVIGGMTVIDAKGVAVFRATQPDLEVDNEDDFWVLETGVQSDLKKSFTHVVVPLRSRFGFDGKLTIHVRNKYIVEQIHSAVKSLPYAALLGSLVLGAVGFFNLAPRRISKMRMDQFIFMVLYLFISGIAIYELGNLYSSGVYKKAQSLVDGLTERISIIYDLDLSLDDVEGLDRTFESFRRQNPDLETVALIVDGVAVNHNSPAVIGKSFVPDMNAFGASQIVDDHPGLDVKVYVSIPYRVVFLTVARSAKTFVVLLVASGFMAGLFFQLGGALRRLRNARETLATDGRSAVDAIRPVLFMGFLIENLAVSFLPQLMQKSVIASGLPSSLASLMFMAYFIAFAGALVPAGVYAGKRGPKPLILAGAIVTAISTLLMASYDHYQMIVLARMIAGVGQGLLFIGSQSYILAYAAADKRTQSAGIIVYTFNGGMLSGMVIGGLLVSHVGSSGVFWIGAAIAVSIGLYTWLLISDSPVPPEKERSREMARARLGAPTKAVAKGSILEVFGSVGFMWTTLLVGIPAKAILTGVVIFAMPLVLAAQNLAQEDIGQIIMFYALGVLLSSHFVSRYADRVGRIKQILFIGLVLSGAGLCVIGLIGWSAVSELALGPFALTLILLLGTLVVGVGHGCINAPVVTHIAATDVARRLGDAPVTAFYRFIERVGHIAGPLVVGQLFFISRQSPLVIGWLGIATLVCAIIFIVRRAPD